MSYLIQALVTLVQFIVGMYLVIVLLRFLLQKVRADFYNPVSQAIVKLTNPPLRVLRRFIPGYAGIDWPGIVLIIIIQALEICLVALLVLGKLPALSGLLVLTLAGIIRLCFFLYIALIFVGVIISWINPGAYNPVTILIYQLTEPIMHPVRRRLPATAGLDFSPMIVLLVLYLGLTLIVAPLQDLGHSLAGIPFRLF
ncbi:MAG: YggT family protein [Thiotrichales bacterium]|nr:YggT family protein [Thiotrichales bacterium]